jgi:hypothetical protein
MCGQMIWLSFGVWQNQGGGDSALNCITNSVFSLTLRLNSELTLQYVPSTLNDADAPSRSIYLIMLNRC